MGTHKFPTAEFAVFAAAFLLSSAHAAPHQAKPNLLVAAKSCKQAVTQSRLICLSGANCQREISPILRACNASGQASCSAAREDLQTYCGAQSPWYGSRECEGALQQVSHYCGR